MRSNKPTEGHTVRFRIKNPFRRFFKPKEKPDNPLDRIPEAWKKTAQPQDNVQEKTQEARRSRGRPLKKVKVDIPPTKVESQPEKPKTINFPKYSSVRLRSYQTMFKFKTIPGFRSVKRWIAALLLVTMIISVGTLFFVAPTYSPIIMINGFILIDYLWITRSSNLPQEAVKFKNPQQFADWLKKQNVVFEVDKKGEE